jgi:hypothetical protein
VTIPCPNDPKTLHFARNLHYPPLWQNFSNTFSLISDTRATKCHPPWRNVLTAPRSGNNLEHRGAAALHKRPRLRGAFISPRRPPCENHGGDGQQIYHPRAGRARPARRLPSLDRRRTMTNNRRQYPHCTETKSPIALPSSARLPERHPRHSPRCCIGVRRPGRDKAMGIWRAKRPEAMKGRNNAMPLQLSHRRAERFLDWASLRLLSSLPC